MNFKTLASIAMLVLCGYASRAENEQKKTQDAHITGHVLDKSTGEHIPYATITANGTTIGTSSDATGHFLLRNVPPGKYTLTASFIGYKSQEQEVEVTANRTVEIKFNLEPASITMDEVVVTGSRHASLRRESSAIVGVVNAKLFEKTAANNMAEVLNFQPGLRVEYDCSNCGVPQLRINGLEGQYSQILLDSRPIFSSLAAVYGLEQLPASMIERVEVIRGGGSALFGSSAIGGVVNIITKDPVRNSLTVSNQSGFYEGGGADINTAINGSFVSDNNRAGIYLFGMVKSRDAYDRNGDGFSETPQINSETIGFRGYYKLSALSRLTGEYHHISEYRRGGNKRDLPPHQADIAEQLRHKINGGGLKYDYTSRNARHILSVYSSVQHIDRDSYFGTDQNLNAYGTTQDMTVVAGTQYDYVFNRCLFMPARLTVGFEFTDNELRDEMLGYNRLINQSSISYGLYAQNEWKNEKFSLLIGARLDKHNKIANPIVSPRFNVRYTPIPQIGIRASYSSGYRAPQAYEEDLHVAAVGGEVAIITLDPDLRPEYSHSVSASVDLNHRFGSVSTSLLIEGFYTTLQDVFKLQEIGHDADGNLLLERRNASGATVAGVNFELKVGFTPNLSLDAGFTLQQSRYAQPEHWSEDPNVPPTRRMLRSPDAYGYAALNYEPLRGLSFSATANYSGSMLVPHYAGYIKNDTQTLTPDFWDLGLRAAYDIRLSDQMKLQVSCGVKNVLDAFQEDVDSGVMRDAGYIYGPAAPRTYYAGLKFTI